MIYATASGTFLAVVQGFPTGLTGTVGIQVIDSTGSVVTPRTTVGITESPAGSGIYVKTLTAPATSGQYVVVWDDGTVSPSTVATEDLTVGATLAAIKAKTDTLGSGTTTVTSPIAASGTITLYRGDDYFNADGRALRWTSTSWPDLTGATISLELGTTAASTTFTKAGTVITPAGTAVIQVELGSTDTSSLTVGSYALTVVATLSSGHKATLVSATCVVLNP